MTSSKSMYYSIQVLKCDTTNLWKKHWRSKIHRFISTKNNHPSLFVEISIGNISQKTNVINNTSPTWNQTFPLLSSKSSETLSIMIHHDTSTSKSVTIGYGEITLNELLDGDGGKEVSIPLRPSSDPKHKSLGSLLVCLRISNAEECAKLALSNLIIDCGEAVDRSEREIENIDTMIKGAEIVMKSNLPKLFRDAVPTLDALSNVIERIADAHPYLKLAWGITTVLYDVVQNQMKFDERVKKLVNDIVIAFYIVQDISHIRRQIESLSRLATEIVDFIIQCCIRIREYSLRSFIGRVLKPGDRSEIEDCEETLNNLKENIDSAFNRQDVTINSRRADDDLLRKLENVLNPNTTSPNVFLLLGAAGTGKSTISTTVAEEYTRNNSLGCHLFFLRGKSDPATVIRTIACSLAEYDQNIAECIEDALKYKVGLTSATLDIQFDTFLSTPLHQSRINSKSILIVLDALDECGSRQTRATLIRVLRDKLPSLPPNYRFLITSRPEFDIQSLFHSPQFEVVRLEEHDGREDVRKYINSSLSELQQIKMVSFEDEEEMEEMGSALGEAANGLFIWASTAMRMIKDNIGDHQSKLEELASTKSLSLDHLYSISLRDALAWNDKMKELFRDVFGLILFGKEQMRDEVIDGILGMKKGRTDGMLSCLRALVIYHRGEPIRLYHTSFYDYLTNMDTGSEAWYIDEIESKRKITEQCFVGMDRMLHFNMCHLESSYVANRDIVNLEERVHNYISSSLYYICRYWSNHLLDTPYSDRMRDALRRFAYNHLLFWLEVMSVTNTLDTRGGSILTHAISWIGDHDRELFKFLTDFHHQISIFSTPISFSTPHIYMSLLPLSKDDSIFSRHYSKYCGTLSIIEYNGRKLRSACLKQIMGHSHLAYSVSFSPDGTQIVSGSFDKTIGVWDAASGRLILGPIKCDCGVFSVRFSPDGSFIASGLGDGSIKIWNSRDGELLGVLFERNVGSIMSLQFSRNGDYIVSGSYDGVIQIWDVESRKLHKELPKSHSDGIWSVSISNDGCYVASGSIDKTVIIWNILNTPITPTVLRGHTDEVYSVMFAPGGNTVASGSYDGTIRIWNTSDGELVHEIPQFGSDKVSSVVYSPDGNHILSGTDHGTIRMWNTSNISESPKLFHGHISIVFDISFASNSSRFVSGSADFTIRVWDVEGGVTDSEDSHKSTNEVYSISISRDGQFIASGMMDGTVCIYNTRSGNIVLGPLKGHTDIVGSVTFSPDGNLVASGSADKQVRLWNMEGDSDILVGPGDDVLSVAFSPNGLNIVAGSRDKMIYVWDVKSKKLCFDPIGGHTDWIITIRYSSDGTKIISGSRDCTIRIWDSASGNMIGNHFEGHVRGVWSVVYSSNDTQVVSVSSDSTILIWDAETRNIYRVIKKHSDAVTSLAFSLDGKRFLSGSFDQAIRIWDVESGESICGPFVGHSAWVQSVEYFPYGNRFASGSSDGTIRIWSIPKEDVEWNMREDGWIVGRNNELLIWIPNELRHTVIMPTCSLTINCPFETKLDFSGHFKGRSWTNGIPFVR
ncbi:nucleotide-binding-oligomerization-domain like receptor [Pyrrhoderma noxium]|uniref:Nucleotide-binding-oligomerization-domain like receptor n=1 Tax=Pyrrhoderma noxium TaxID=2282107 RepID=A0A286UED4_9AGAM|nr:nucleotide-binding-oligomerization-domain like receptor [Pyrrhoderma noxium]